MRRMVNTPAHSVRDWSCNSFDEIASSHCLPTLRTTPTPLLITAGIYDCEMGFRGRVAGQSWALDVRFGSKADIKASPRDVRFTPKSRHWNSVAECPLCAKSGHCAAQHSPETSSPQKL